MVNRELGNGGTRKWGINLHIVIALHFLVFVNGCLLLHQCVGSYQRGGGVMYVLLHLDHDSLWFVVFLKLVIGRVHTVLLEFVDIVEG